MSNTVWLSQYRNNKFVNIYGIDATLPNTSNAVRYYELKKKQHNNTITEAEKKEYYLMEDEALSYIRKWQIAKYIDKDDMPNQIFKKPESDLPEADEVVFQIIDGFVIFNQTCYDVMSKFNLGKTHFSQVYIYDIETQEKLSDTPYYFINIAETREYLEVETSQGIRKHSRQAFYYINNPKDSDIKLQQQSENCDVDMWYDPILKESLFLSDELTQALLNSGITQEQLGLVSCQTK